MNDRGMVVGSIDGRPVMLSLAGVQYLAAPSIRGRATAIDSAGNIAGLYADPGLAARYPIVAHTLEKLGRFWPIQLEPADRLVLWRRVR